MKEVSFTLSDYSPSDCKAGIFGFVVYQVYYLGESYGYFATRKAAEERISSLKKHFDYSYKIDAHFVSF